MKKNSKKGFVITEMLMVAVFVVTIFTFIYTSTIPLIGKYRDIAERENDIGIIYKLYNIRNLIREDDNFSKIGSEGLKRIKCGDLINTSSCSNLLDYMGLENYDLFYIDNIATDISNPLLNEEEVNYLNKYLDDDKKTLLLLDKNDHTIAHLAFDHENVMNILPTTITNMKANISRVYFKKEYKSVMDSRYEAATIKADITFNNQGQVLAWLEPDPSISSKYILYIASTGTTYLKTGNELFKNFTSVREIDFENVDTSKVTNMASMFQGCSALTNINVSTFNTSNVTTMYGMFYNCSSLSNLNVKSFDTQEVTNMASMFQICASLHILDLSSFNTKNVINMAYMFSGCTNLLDVAMTRFDTQKVTNMGYMFSNCPNLTELNLNNFDTSKVTDMGYMFKDDGALVNIYVSDLWNTAAVTNSSNMFGNTLNIYGGNGTKYNSSVIDKTYARIDSQNSQAGYLRYKSNDDNYIQVANLIQNGSFESDYSNWNKTELTNANAIAVNTSNKKYHNKSSSRIATNITSKNYLKQDILFIGGHKYYFFVYGYTSSGTNQTIKNNIGDRSGSNIDIVVKNNLGWLKKSVIYTATVNEILSVNINYGITTDETFVDGIGIIDLTDVFGRGSEPTKEWCDTNIDYHNDIVRYHV